MQSFGWPALPRTLAHGQGAFCPLYIQGRRDHGKDGGMKLEEKGDKVAGHYFRAPQGWRALFNDPESYSPFFKAIVDDDVHHVEREICSKPELLNAPITVLYWGDNGGQQANSTSCSVKSRTPLMVAAYHGSLRVLAFFLYKGADTCIACDMGTAEAVALSAEDDSPNKAVVLAMLRDASVTKPTLDPEVSAPRHSPTNFMFPDASAESSESTKKLGSRSVRPSRPSQQAAGRVLDSTTRSYQRSSEVGYCTRELTRPEFSTDSFRLFCFKVLRCSKKYAHDWRACPFAHPTENARRRDPQEFHYCTTACPDYKQGCCSRGNLCCFAHGVYESWLHPARYRTQLCKDGSNCVRPVCFFAHDLTELRTPTHTWTPTPNFMLSSKGPPFVSTPEQPSGLGLQGVASAPNILAGAFSPRTPQHVLSTTPGFYREVSASPLSGPDYGNLTTPAPDAHQDMSAPAPNHGSGRGVVEVGIIGSGSSEKGTKTWGSEGESPDTLNSSITGSARTGLSSCGFEDSNALSHDSYGIPDVDALNHALPGGSVAAAASGQFSITAPRMSNEFARRHGLNPRDSPIINLQKIALQQTKTKQEGRGKDTLGKDSSSRQRKVQPNFQDPAPAKYGATPSNQIGTFSMWPSYSSPMMQDVNCQALQLQMEALSMAPPSTSFLPSFGDPLYPPYGARQQMLYPMQQHPPQQHQGQQSHQQPQRLQQASEFNPQEHLYVPDPHGLSLMPSQFDHFHGTAAPESLPSMGDPTGTLAALNLDKLKFN